MAVRAVVQYPRPDRSPAAVAQRRSITDQARASNARQGYINDSDLEALVEAYVAGDLTLEEKGEAVRLLSAERVAAYKAADAAETQAERR